MPRSKNEIAILLSLSGYTSWVLGDTLIKLSSETLSIPRMLAVNSLASLAFIFLAACFNGGYKQLSTRRYSYQLISSIFAATSGFAAFVAVTYLALADFYTIVFTAPLMITILARVFLNERTDWRIWVAIVAGFLGIVVAMQGSGSGQQEISWIGVGLTGLSVLSFCISMLMVRAAPRENNYALGFWPRVLAVALTGGYLLLCPDKTALDFHGALYALLSGALLAFGIVLNNLSLRYAAVSVVAPYHYTQIIGGAIAGYLIWHNVPTLSIIFGALIVATAGIYILKRQRIVAQQFAGEPT